MVNKMTAKRLFEAEKEEKANRVKAWHSKETSHILFEYGVSLYHVYSTIFAGDGDIVTKLTTIYPADIKDDFSNVQEYEIS